MTTAIFGQVKRMQHYAVIGGAALLIIASVAGMVAIIAGGMRGEEGMTGGEPRVAAVGARISTAHERYAAMKERQFEQADQQDQASRVARVSAAHERYATMKERQLEQADQQGQASRVARVSTARERYAAMKERQLEQRDSLSR